MILSAWRKNAFKHHGAMPAEGQDMLDYCQWRAGLCWSVEQISQATRTTLSLHPLQAPFQNPLEPAGKRSCPSAVLLTGILPKTLFHSDVSRLHIRDRSGTTHRAVKPASDGHEWFLNMEFGCCIALHQRLGYYIITTSHPFLWSHRMTSP